MSEGELRVSPLEVDFGSVYAGAGASASVRVTNPTRLEQTVGLVVDLPFASPPSLVVPGGSSVELILNFNPKSAGPFDAALAIGSQSVKLRGAGLEVLECREPPDGCNTSTFDPANGQCVEGVKPDGATCAGRCVTRGNCSNGTCRGDLLDCSDHNACTDDTCTDQAGCGHPPKTCPGSSTNPCQVAGCEPSTGCLLTDAPDGTLCGARNCRTNTTHVCIAAQCLERPLPTRECLNQAAYLKASNAEAADYFGSRLALSADGSTLAVGTTVESSAATGVNGNQADNSAAQSGAVYLFRRVGSGWAQEAYLKASNTGAGDSFGYSVALSADGTTLVVGAYLEDSNAIGVEGDEANDSAHDSGAVYVFRRSSGTWAQQAYLKASNTEQGDEFGASVSLSADGDTLAVGAYGEDSSSTGVDALQTDNSADEAGAVYLFRRTGSAWAQEAYVKASTAEGGDLFGFTVALSPDGATLAVGALGEDSSESGVDGNEANNAAPQSGAVFVFRHTAIWAQEAYLKASNTGAADGFGFSLALSTDGSTLAVGAWGEDSGARGVNQNQLDNSASQSGAVYVFGRSAGARWAQAAYLKAFNTQLGDDFGFSLALSGDGSTLAVGAWSENSDATGIDGEPFNSAAPDSGAVYLFRRAAFWAQDAYLKASNAEPGDVFGYSVAISGDGTTLVVAALGEDSRAVGVDGDQSDNAANDSGAVYVFSTQ